MKHTVTALVGVITAGLCILALRYAHGVLDEKVTHLEQTVTKLEQTFDAHEKNVDDHLAKPTPSELPPPDGEPDAEFDKLEPCLDGEKVLRDCALEKRLKNEGNRNWCVEVAEAPPDTSDEVMHRVGYECDDKLRKHVAWVRHGLGTRAKDRKRVVRYYNVTHEVAQAVCPFLDCSSTWLGVVWDKTPGVVRTCKVMKGKACEY